MTTQKRILTPPTSPSPQRMRLLPPSLSEVQSSPLSAGSFVSFPATSSPLQPSQDFAFVKERARSPDLFEPFVYTPDMEVDFRRIDMQASQEFVENNMQSSPPTTPVAVSAQTTTTRNQKTWVVFLGKVPGLYDSA